MSTPTDVRRRRTMARIARDDADARFLAGRRADCRARGYFGPLTRAEASARVLRELAARAGR